MSSPAGFTPSRLLVLHPLLSPRNVHLSLSSPSLSPPSRPPRPLSPGVLQVKLEDIISHQSAECAAPLPSPTSLLSPISPSHPLNRADSPPWPREFCGELGEEWRWATVISVRKALPPFLAPAWGGLWVTFIFRSRSEWRTKRSAKGDER